ncbi:MAG TPA: NAD(+) diphosphatase [Burkholderiales bacterium]|jgi:NAD+ diphosphatase|nr:NAD(+) diphosphatase [Burkholderiales bacterium]
MSQPRSPEPTALPFGTPGLFIPGLVAPAAREQSAWWFAFRGNEILTIHNDDAIRIPAAVDSCELCAQPLRELYIGCYDHTHCFALELPENAEPPSGAAFRGLRSLFDNLDDALVGLAGRAFELIEWDRTHQFCGSCGAPMTTRRDERARVCSGCGRVAYPVVSPAMMVLITRGRELLLARKASFPPHRYSALAGFVEPGETLENTVIRETREEVGVEIDHLRYFGSQPWPFPHSLMVAFVAEYAGGEIRPDGLEIEAAQWFDADHLPQLPPRISISRRLIDTVAAELRSHST